MKTSVIASVPQVTLHKRFTSPRCFTLEWNWSKRETVKHKNTGRRFINAHSVKENERKQFAYGVQWPSTGAFPDAPVSLSNGNTYRSLAELRERISEYGTGTLTWLDSQESEELA